MSYSYDYYSSYPSYYDYSSSASSATSDAATATILAGLGVILFIMLAIGIVLLILQVIANWKIFTKAGEKGWKSIIPIYNSVILFKISGISPLFVLVYLLGFIPFVGTLAILGVTIYQANSLAKSFGKDAGFTVGLVLLPTIFYMILGFGKAEYIGNGNVTTAANYQGDGVVNVSTKPVDENPTDNNEDNAQL